MPRGRKKKNQPVASEEGNIFLKIGDTWRIGYSEHSFDVQQRRTKRDGSEGWRPPLYYSTMQAALLSILDQAPAVHLASSIESVVQAWKDVAKQIEEGIAKAKVIPIPPGTLKAYVEFKTGQAVTKNTDQPTKRRRRKATK